MLHSQRPCDSKDIPSHPAFSSSPPQGKGNMTMEIRHGDFSRSDRAIALDRAQPWTRQTLFASTREEVTNQRRWMKNDCIQKEIRPPQKKESDRNMEVVQSHSWYIMHLRLIDTSIVFVFVCLCLSPSLPFLPHLYCLLIIPLLLICCAPPLSCHHHPALRVSL
jgi:hypothetical protein